MVLELGLLVAQEALSKSSDEGQVELVIEVRTERACEVKLQLNDVTQSVTVHLRTTLGTVGLETESASENVLPRSMLVEIETVTELPRRILVQWMCCPRIREVVMVKAPIHRRSRIEHMVNHRKLRCLECHRFAKMAPLKYGQADVSIAVPDGANAILFANADLASHPFLWL